MIRPGGAFGPARGMPTAGPVGGGGSGIVLVDEAGGAGVVLGLSMGIGGEAVGSGI